MLTDRLKKMLEPLVETLGYELVHLEFGGDSGATTLRIYIDHLDAARGGITLEDCETVSREVSARLDVDDPIREQYQLEISSPGSDRPLAKRTHFERFAGERARIVMNDLIDGRRRFTGQLKGIEDDAVRIEVDGEVVDLPLQSIDKARLLPE